MRWIVDVRFRIDAATAQDAEAAIARSVACRDPSLTVEFVETQRNDQARPSWKVDGE